MFRHILIAGLWAAGLMFALFLGGHFFPPQIWIVVLYPGMVVAEALFPVLTASVIESLMNSLGVDEAPTLYVILSVVCAFLFWWLCDFVGIKVRAHLLRDREVGRMAVGRLR